MHSQQHTRLIITEDGSHSLYVPHLDENYHSTHGAILESLHVYINAGLNACKLQHVNILEIGFGTGLNAFLTLIESKKSNKQIHYYSIELYPLDIRNVKLLNYAEQLTEANGAEHFLAMHKATWDKTVRISQTFSLHKIKADFSTSNNIETNAFFDVIYFDAFAPEKQPEMWTQQIFNKLFSLCNKNAIIITYCAKGVVRRMLQSAGFTVERLPGPPGKREILRGKRM